MSRSRTGSSGPKYHEALANSPFGNDLLLEFAKACVDAEALGTRDVPDLLVVSFSSNDLIGHTWGPDSQEVMDVTLRSDAIMADLLAHLDRRVGKDHYLLAVTADHGVCPMPEASRAKGIAGRSGWTRPSSRGSWRSTSRARSPSPSRPTGRRRRGSKGSCSRGCT